MGNKISKFNYFIKSKENEKLKSYLPDDANEIDRYHMHHFLKRYIFKNNFSSPIEEKLIRNKCKVLDVACGAGTWLLDLSINYPRSNFFGLDIKPMFPSEIKPDNLEFIQADIMNGLPYPDNEFDFVHQETMFLLLTPDQWNYVISEIIRVTKPGGWIEFSEPYSFATGAGSLFINFYTAALESFLSRGIDIQIVQQIESILESNSNLSNIRKDEKSFILGQNGDKVGEAYLDFIFKDAANSETNLKSISQHMGLSKEEYLKLLGKIIEELNETRLEVFIYRFYSQKNDENNDEEEDEEDDEKDDENKDEEENNEENKDGEEKNEEDEEDENKNEEKEEEENKNEDKEVKETENKDEENGGEEKDGVL